MKDHHYAWLSRHPDRDEQWLQQALSAGFDVHHVDGDHGNNDPENLVLIERRDHNLLHGFSDGFTRKTAKKQRGPRKKTISNGLTAHCMRQEGRTWRQIGEHLGISHVSAMNAAKVYLASRGS